jgi:hypothetical protein
MRSSQNRDCETEKTILQMRISERGLTTSVGPSVSEVWPVLRVHFVKGWARITISLMRDSDSRSIRFKYAMVSVSQFAAENAVLVVLILLVALFSVNAILCVFFMLSDGSQSSMRPSRARMWGRVQPANEKFELVIQTKAAPNSQPPLSAQGCFKMP